MVYQGAVRPGGPAEERTLAAVTVVKFSVGDMDNNVYILACRRTGQRLLIDAADDADRIMDVLGDGRLSTVVTTHRHWDHVRATAEVVSRTGAESLAHADDAEEVDPVHRTVADGDVIAFGSGRIEVIHLVGHTPGSIALLYDDPTGHPHLFTGDSLFPGGPGKTTSPRDFTSLMDDLERKVFDRLPDDTWVYPGHGNDTTLGAERPHLSEWRARGW